MNIKQTIPHGECGAKRCKQEPVATVPGSLGGFEDDRRVPLCERHVEMANKKYDLEGIVDGIVPIAAVPATAAVVVPEKELAAETEEFKGVLEVVKEFEIDGQEDLEFAAVSLQDVKGRYNRLKAKQEEITKPLNEALKAARALFKPPMTILEKIEEVLKGKIAEHVQREEEANHAAMQEVAAGDESALAKITSIGEIEGISTRKAWEFEVVDEDLIPDEFWVLDEKAVMAHARSTEGQALPGIVFKPKVTIVSKSA